VRNKSDELRTDDTGIIIAEPIRISNIDSL
jgi:hypothetical protein